MLKIHWQDTYLTNSKNLAMRDGRPTCNRVLTSGSVGIWGFPWGFQWGFLWVWDGYGDWNAIPTAALLIVPETMNDHISTEYRKHITFYAPPCRFPYMICSCKVASWLRLKPCNYVQRIWSSWRDATSIGLSELMRIKFLKPERSFMELFSISSNRYILE